MPARAARTGRSRPPRKCWAASSLSRQRIRVCFLQTGSPTCTPWTPPPVASRGVSGPMTIPALPSWVLPCCKQGGYSYRSSPSRRTRAAPTIRAALFAARWSRWRRRRASRSGSATRFPSRPSSDSRTHSALRSSHLPEPASGAPRLSMRSAGSSISPRATATRSRPTTAGTPCSRLTWTAVSRSGTRRLSRVTPG